MGSANPNKFLPSQWLKAMKRQFTSSPKTSNAEYESKLPVTSSLPINKQDCSQSVIVSSQASSSSILVSSPQSMLGSPSKSKHCSSLLESYPKDETPIPAKTDVTSFFDPSDQQSHSYFHRSHKLFSRKFHPTSFSNDKKPYCYPNAYMHTSSKHGISYQSRSPLSNDSVGSFTKSIEQKRGCNFQIPDEDCSYRYAKHQLHSESQALKVSKHYMNENSIDSNLDDKKQKKDNKEVLLSTSKSSTFCMSADTKSTRDQRTNRSSAEAEKPAHNHIKYGNQDSSIFRHPDRKLHRTWFNTYKNKESSKLHNMTLLEINNYLYQNCDQDVLPWSYRWKSIKTELENYKIDILCLQEVEEVNYHDSVRPWLTKHNYVHKYKRRTGQDPNKPDGVLTACQSKKFEIVESVPVEYYRPFERLTSWHNVGLILVLKFREKSLKENPLICVANTHLVYNPNRGDVKLIQLATFFAEIDKVLKEYREKAGYQLPLVICGDFNSTPFSPLFDFITKGKLYYEGLSSKHVSGQKERRGGRDLPDYLLPNRLSIDENCTYINGDETDELRRNHVLRHSLGPLSSTGERHKPHEATTIQDYGITVDYIFYSHSENTTSSQESYETPAENPEKFDSSPRNFADSTSAADDCGQNFRDIPKKNFEPFHNSFNKKYELNLNNRLSLCSGHAISKANGLPNSFHSSDHLPVAARFSIVHAT